MCVNMVKYFLVKDNTTGKKQVLFKFPINLENRLLYENVPFLLHQGRLAIKGVSQFQYLNSLLYRKDCSIVDLISVPCGICEECLQSTSRDWATRIMLECKQHQDNYFVTLTYDDEHLPSDYNLVKEEISLFNKKLKTYLNRAGLDSTFRFYGVGEYGGETARPHYHVIYFGLPLNDLKFYKVSENGDIYYNSAFLEGIWQKGFVVVTGVSVASASYVARYCDKKKRLTKLQKEDLLKKGIVPEFSVMSRRPGIGSQEYEHIIERVKDNQSYVYVGPGQKNNIPLYFMKKIKSDYDGTDFLIQLNQQLKYRSNVCLAKKVSVAESSGMSPQQLNEYNSTLKNKKKRNL